MVAEKLHGDHIYGELAPNPNARLLTIKNTDSTLEEIQAKLPEGFLAKEPNKHKRYVNKSNLPQ